MITVTINTRYGEWRLPPLTDKKACRELQLNFNDSCQKGQPLQLDITHGWVVLGPDIVKSSMLKFFEHPDDVESDLLF